MREKFGRTSLRAVLFAFAVVSLAGASPAGARESAASRAADVESKSASPASRGREQPAAVRRAFPFTIEDLAWLGAVAVPLLGAGLLAHRLVPEDAN